MAKILKSFSGRTVVGVEATGGSRERTWTEAEYQRLKAWEKARGITTKDMVELEAFHEAFEADGALDQEAIGAEVGEDAYFELYSKVGE